MAEQAEFIASGETDIAKWRAVLVKCDFKYDDSNNQLPRQVYDDQKTVILRVGEKGVSIREGEDKYRRPWHWVCFRRQDINFHVPVPQNHLEPGVRYRPTAEKLATLQILSVPSLNNALLQWSSQGTLLDRYVKALWIGIRAQRPRLESLGINAGTARRMFDWEYFIPTVNKVLGVFRPRFRQAMEVPGQSVPGLIAACDKLTASWPGDGPGVVYIRAYTHLDAGHANINSTGLYVGWSRVAHTRHLVHTQNTSLRAFRDTDRPTHYDVARKASHCHVLVVLHQHDVETLGTGGTPEARLMAEQTVMLMLKSYAPWVESSADKIDLYIQRARILQKVERQVRSDIDFQPTWRVDHGTNVSSPLFEIFNRYDSPGSAALIQSIPLLRPHPQLPAKTIMRATVSFHRIKTYGVGARFLGHRTGDPRTSSPIMIYLPTEIAARIRADVEPTPSTAPFYATLAFELMEGGHEHERPYCGLPAVGPYQNFGAPNALGVRVEWKHHSSDHWYSAPVQISLKRHRGIANALRKGDPTKIERLYQEAIALIQMIRGEECPNAPRGFWRSLGFRGNRPTIQKLEFNHLRQAVRWVAHIPTPVAPPTKATEEENRRLLKKHRAPVMTVGKRLPADDAFYYVDRSSSLSKIKGINCDTCVILSRRRTTPIPTECEYDPETESCPACTALNRPCTFTPLTPLLAGWVGKDVNPEHYATGGLAGKIMFPRHGAGDLRRLVPHLGIPEEEIKVTEIREPCGWDSLYPFLDSGEDDENDGAGDDGEEDDNEEGEDL